MNIDEIKERIERESRAEELWCPHCKSKQDQDTKYHCVSMWGEDGAKSVNCGSCAHDFWVKENVKRTFTTYRVNPDFEEEGYQGE